MAFSQAEHDIWKYPMMAYLGEGGQTWAVGLQSDAEEGRGTSDCSTLRRIWIALVQAVCRRWHRLTATAAGHCRLPLIVRERGLVSVLPNVLVTEHDASKRNHRMQWRSRESLYQCNQAKSIRHMSTDKILVL